jgi:hypothetical protein
MKELNWAEINSVSGARLVEPTPVPVAEQVEIRPVPVEGWFGRFINEMFPPLTIDVGDNQRPPRIIGPIPRNAIL